jgi:integrase
MASIQQRGDSFRVLWRLGGSKTGRQQSTTWPDEDLAKQAKAIADARRHRVTDEEVYDAILGRPKASQQPDTPTLKEWTDTWLRSKTRITPGVRARYRRQLDMYILPTLGDMRLHEITGVDVSMWLTTQQGRVSDATVTRYYSVLHAVLAYAVVEGKIPSNPARRTDFVRDIVAHDDQGDEEHVYLTPQEFELIVNAADEKVRPLLWFLVLTGTRYSEATAVAVKHVKLFGKPPSVQIHRAWKQDESGKWYLGSTKGRTKRVLPLAARLIDLLPTLVASEDRETLVFRAPMGGRVIYSNFRNRFWEPAVAAAMRCAAHPPLLEEVDEHGRQLPDPGKLAVSTCDCQTRLRQKPTIHDLRHTYTAWLIAQNQPLAAISRSLGHHSTAITERVYAGILPKVSHGLAMALDATLAPDEPVAVRAG